jgi:hypothetical protein
MDEHLRILSVPTGASWHFSGDPGPTSAAGSGSSNPMTRGRATRGKRGPGDPRQASSMKKLSAATARALRAMTRVQSRLALADTVAPAGAALSPSSGSASSRSWRDRYTTWLCRAWLSRWPTSSASLLPGSIFAALWPCLLPLLSRSGAAASRTLIDTNLCHRLDFDKLDRTADSGNLPAAECPRLSQ